MPKLVIKYTVNPQKAEKMKMRIREQVEDRERREERRRIVLVLLALGATVLRFGLQEALAPVDNPDNSTTFGDAKNKTDHNAVIDQSWYTHPVTLFIMWALITPIALLSIVAAEVTDDWIPFSIKLVTNYYYYIRGLFAASIVVDLLQACFPYNQPASPYHSILGLFNDNVWIDPYTNSKQLSMPSYQTTITSYAACFCIMLINKSFNKWLAHHQMHRITLRALIIGGVSPVVAAISFSCYNDYMTANCPFYIEVYYLSVLLGMMVAILEVQGTMYYDMPPNEYFVILRCHGADKLPIGINLGLRLPMDKNDDDAQQAHYVGALCFRHRRICKIKYYDSIKAQEKNQREAA